MGRNFIKIWFTNVKNHPLYTVINLVGLSSAIACCLLISLFVVDELSYDRRYENADRIFRISRHFEPTDGFNGLELAANAPNVAPLLKENYPEVELAARFLGSRTLVTDGELAFYEDGYRTADKDFFKIFDVEWIAGNPDIALSEPDAIVLTESTAQKYFGTADVLGMTLTVRDADVKRITGVIRDLPHNTHLTADLIASMNAVPDVVLQQWAANEYHTYILLRQGTAIADLESKFPDFMENYYEEGSSDQTGMTAMNVADIHLRGISEFNRGGSILTVYAFVAIAFAILLIAAINFTNLATVRSSHRAREVGLRLSMGATREQIIWQFMGEAVLISFFSMLLAFPLVETLLPWFNSFVGKDISSSILTSPRLIFFMLSFVVIVGFIAGSYPAFYISALKPGHILKGEFHNSGKKGAFSELLIIVQFSAAIVLIAATATIYGQIKFARNMELGFNKDQVVILSGSPTQLLGDQWEAMKRRLLEHENISAVTASLRVPGETNLEVSEVLVEGMPKTTNIANNAVDFDFFNTYQITTIAGRSFDAELMSDQVLLDGEYAPVGLAGYVLSESAAYQLGLSPQEAIGRKLEFIGWPGEIVGVVEDVHFESVRNKMRPLLYWVPPAQDEDTGIGPNNLAAAALRISPVNIDETLAYIDRIWQEFMPGYPTTYRFLDDDFVRIYADEQRQAALLGYFSMLAVFIACVGLYGLSSFNAQARAREISVRKVLGSNVWELVVLLTNDYSRLVLLSNAIAWPVAWFAMTRWLENFAYRIDLTPLILIGSGLIALCIAWVTVGGIAVKAASARPVLALRSE